MDEEDALRFGDVVLNLADDTLLRAVGAAHLPVPR
jgi:hypothetical protein